MVADGLLPCSLAKKGQERKEKETVEKTKGQEQLAVPSLDCH